MNGDRTIVRPLSLWTPVIGFMVAVIWFSDDASLATPEMLSDKLLHAIAYFLFGLACLRAFHGGFRKPTAVRSIGAIIFALTFAAFDEWRQTGVLARDASIGDWGADTIGTLLSWICLRVWRWRSA